MLGMIAQGYRSREVAELLVVSKRTVDFHLANIRDKLKFASVPCYRTQLIGVSRKVRLVDKDMTAIMRSRVPVPLF